MNQSSQSSFSFDKAVRDVHFLAKSGKPDNKFKRLDVVGNGDEFGFSVLDEFGDVVESEFKMEGFVLGNIFF